MRVHIVCERLDTNRILPRLAKYLAELNGWTLGDAPSQNADLNYFVPYITWRQRYNDWHKTRIAAYFSHRDINNKMKARWWDEAAKKIDLCTITSNQYREFLDPAKTVYVRPPVEIDRFEIKPWGKSIKPVVGLMGYTYGDGRKGEDLVKDLLKTPIAKTVEWRASGRGWPVKTVSYPWKDIPKFVQGLDVLLCPSKFEGVPMPPLEALACGVKIVIPIGVGMLDDLPDIPGIYRYEAENLVDMAKTLGQAISSGPVNRGNLRNVVVNQYTAETWSKDHRQHFEEFFNNVKIEKGLPNWKGNSGVYVVAFGEPARKCAQLCIDSIHKHTPGLPVCLVSTAPLGPEDHFVKHKDADIGGRIAKLKANELAPKSWKYVLYFDADIEAIGDISFLFQALQDGWEFLICKDMDKYATTDKLIRPDNKDECNVTWDILGTREGAMQYNGGMMAFRRNDRTAKFFKLWQEEWQRWGKRDQGALLRALYRQPLRMYILMNQWNASDRYPLPPGEIAVMHHNVQARRWGGLVEGRLDSTVAWQKVSDWERRHGYRK